MKATHLLRNIRISSSFVILESPSIEDEFDPWLGDSGTWSRRGRFLPVPRASFFPVVAFVSVQLGRVGACVKLTRLLSRPRHHLRFVTRGFIRAARQRREP